LEENCGTCPKDCGCSNQEFCNLSNQCQSKKQDNVSCEQNLECSGNYCVHGICRSSSTYCGDNYCDIGECRGCRADCDYDLNKDGIVVHDYNDLMTAYKCFLGIKTCDNYYQNWNLIKQEYDCFIEKDI